MKLAITSEEEIKSLMDLCIEIEDFSKELKTYNYENIEIMEEHSKILYNIKRKSDNMEEFMTRTFEMFDIIHFRRILWNCSTLLTNCADLSLTALDYKPEIKAGFEAIDLLKEMEAFGAIENDYKEKVTAILSMVPDA